MEYSELLGNYGFVIAVALLVTIGVLAYHLVNTANDLHETSAKLQMTANYLSAAQQKDYHRKTILSAYFTNTEILDTALIMDIVNNPERHLPLKHNNVKES